MQWSEIRHAYPNQWLVIEALQAHTTPDNQRQLDKIAVIERCDDGIAAMQSYRRLHQQHPAREFYFVHTSREELNIHERRWLLRITSQAVHKFLQKDFLRVSTCTN